MSERALVTFPFEVARVIVQLRCHFADAVVTLLYYNSGWSHSRPLAA
jgi:hypothetical protein